MDLDLSLQWTATRSVCLRTGVWARERGRTAKLTDDLRKLHHQELHDLLFLNNYFPLTVSIFWCIPRSLIEGSETSANINQTLGIHPKIETVNTEHSESLKSIIISHYFRTTTVQTTHYTGLAVNNSPVLKLREAQEPNPRSPQTMDGASRWIPFLGNFTFAVAAISAQLYLPTGQSGEMLSASGAVAEDRDYLNVTRGVRRFGGILLASSSEQNSPANLGH
jgi:hypothetical protein